MKSPFAGLRRSRRITAKVTITMALLIMLTVAIMTGSEVVGQRAVFEGQLRENGLALSRTLNDVMANSLYFRDMEKLRHLAVVAKAQPEIDRLTVFAPDGRILIGPGIEKFASGFVPPQILAAIKNGREPDIRIHEEHVDLVTPVIVGGDIIGGLRFEFDRAALEDQINVTVFRHLWQGGLFMLLGIGLSYLFAQSIVRPVRELTQVTDRIAAGDFEASAAGRERDDEIGELSRSLRTMAASLREAEREKAEEQNARLLEANEQLQAEIAERKLAQQDSEKSRQDLEEALLELRNAQQKMVQQERLRAVGQMSSGIAHDINNRLQVILALTDRLLVQAEPGNPEGEEDLRMIRASVEDAADVIGLLRDFYRPETKYEAFQPVKIGDIANMAVQLTEPRWKDLALSRGIDLDVQVEIGDLPIIDGSAVELREALINLLFNAIDAQPSGGRIRLRAFSTEDEVIIEVEDSGAGMPDEVRRRCLEPFFTTKGEGGSGLGLAMVYRTVRRHEGHIEIDSDVGTGTTVRLILPARQRSTATQRKPRAPVSVHSRRILVVDDEPMVRELLGRLLEHDGHDVTTAGDGAHALEQFRSEEFDLVILDRAMPGMNGDELALHIKRDAPDVPIIMLSGFGDLMNATEDRPEGVDVTLGKPIRHADLSAAVASALALDSNPKVAGGGASA